MKRLMMGMVLVTIIVLVVGWGWLNYGPGCNVYAIDVPITSSSADCPDSVRLAVVGDFGDAAQAEADVVALVHGWLVDYVLTVGDNCRISRHRFAKMHINNRITIKTSFHSTSWSVLKKARANRVWAKCTLFLKKDSTKTECRWVFCGSD